MAVSKNRTASRENKQVVSSNQSTSNNQLTCVVSKDTAIEGSFQADQDVRLDGSVKGDVKCSKRLVLGETGKIEGTVEDQHAVIMGTIEGEILVKETLTLKSTALINGNLSAKGIQVEEGARYNGTLKVGGPVTAR
ncbi:MAG: polymer-forming cytoskeletal protein [Bacteroidota bacterium]